MRQEVPNFQEGHILRAKTLQTLRDYSYLSQKLQRIGYSNGIISGLELKSGAGFVEVGEGLFSIEGEIFLQPSSWRVETLSTTSKVFLKLSKIAQNNIKNGDEFEFALVIDERQPEKNEFVLCGYQLQEGAKLREHYVDFQDISTEYDTINLQFAQYSSYSMASLHPKVLTSFAEEMLSCHNLSSVDQNFCLLILSSYETINSKAIQSYLEIKGEDTTSENLYQGLLQVLLQAKQEVAHPEKNPTKKRHTLMID